MATGAFLPPVVTRLSMNIDDFVSGVAKAKAAFKALDGAADVKVELQGLAEAEARLAALTKTQQATIKVATDGVASTAALAASTTATAGAVIPLWRRIFDAIHFGLAIFGENLVADTIGIIAFSASAVQNLGPVVSTIKNLGVGYGELNNYQQAATISAGQFMDKFRAASANAGVFAVFYGGLDLINQRLANSSGVVSQATQAFEQFMAMLVGTFSSPAWGGLLGRSGLIRADLVALFTFFNQVLASVPALVHDFNFLGIGFLGGATALLRFASAVASSDPFIYRLISGGYLLHRAWVYLWTGAGTGPGPLQSFANGLPALGVRFKNFGQIIANTGESYRRFGAATTASLLLGGASAGTVASLGLVLGGVTAIAAEWLIVYELTKNNTNATQQLLGQVSALDQQNQDSIPVWAQGLSQLTQRQQQLTTVTRTGGETIGRAYDRNKNQVSQLNAAIQSQSQGLNNLRTNLGGIERAYGLTGTQAVQVLQALALDGSKAFGPTQRQMIAQYEQAVQAARNPLSQVQYGMLQAANAALDMNARVTGLNNALNAMLTPLNSVIGDSVTFSNDLATMVTNLAASHGMVGLNTDAQKASAQAMAQAYNDASALSQAIFNQTGSVQKSLVPLQQLYNTLQKNGAKGAWVTQEMQALKAAMDALQSKTVYINFVATGAVPAGVGGHQAHVATPGGFASGTSGARSGWAWVGERGPELVKFRGGETVLPHTVSMGYAGGTGGGAVHEINVYLDGKRIYRSTQKEAVNTQRRTGSNGLTKRTR